jgi:hypothetical protein
MSSPMPLKTKKEGEHGGHARGDRHRGERAELRPVMQRVGAADRDEEREDTHDAELGYLVYQHPESGVNIAEEVHLFRPW